MKQSTRLFIAFLLSVGMLPLLAQTDNKKVNQKEETWLWEISGNGLKEPSYLFGTIHILCPGDFSISKNLSEKLQKSKQLVLEVVDADNPMNALAAMEALVMKGTKMKDLYTAEEYREVNKFFTDSIGLDLDTYGSFCPMFFMVSVLPKMMGCSETKSYETELTVLARQQGKEVKEVETLMQQLHFFDTIPYHVQAKELLRLVQEWKTEKHSFAELVTLYKEQKFSQSAAFIHANMGNLIEYRDILLDNRNKAWIPKIKNMAAEKSTLFAFGAGHLGGTNGLIELLKAEGYKVSPLKN